MPHSSPKLYRYHQIHDRPPPMSFIQWSDDPQHVLALLGLAASGLYSGWWITKPRKAPSVPTVTRGPQPHPPAFNRDNDYCRCPDCRRQRSLTVQHGKPPRAHHVLELKAELDQSERIIERLTEHIKQVTFTNRDQALIRSLKEQLTEADNKRRAIAEQLGDYTVYGQ